MKKIVLSAIALALAFSACSKKADEFKLTGSALPETLNGTYAKIYDLDKNVRDSVLIENGAFSYVAPANDTLVGMLLIGETSALFANEVGDFTLTYSVDEVTGVPQLRRGGDANSSFMKVQEVQDKVSELKTTFNKSFDELLAEIGEAEPNEEQLTELENLQNGYMEGVKGVYSSYFTKGGNSMIDWYAFMMMAQSMEPAEYVENFEAAGSLIKNDEQLAQLFSINQAAAKTSVGQQFIDYEIVNPANETKKLSDFREEGKYFLLDFFASWCGPCKMSMPVIAEIEKEFGDKVLTSVSIAVFEQDADGTAYKNAVKDLNITWDSFQDAKSEGANIYGVSGVPTFILFSPEGEILMRGHDIKAIQAKLRELNK